MNQLTTEHGLFYFVPIDDFQDVTTAAEVRVGIIEDLLEISEDDHTTRGAASVPVII